MLTYGILARSKGHSNSPTSFWPKALGMGNGSLVSLPVLKVFLRSFLKGLCLFVKVFFKGLLNLALL